MPKDEVEAEKWYRRAAEQGDASGQFLLGVMFEMKDKVEAYKWWLLAGAQGDEGAKKQIELIERKLSIVQRAEGQRLAREFQPR